MKPFGCRTRTKYSTEQVLVLERVFEETHYPNITTLDMLSDKLAVAVDKLNIWFQNRRSKFKRQSKGNNVGWMRTQIFKDNYKNGAHHVLSPPCLTNFETPSTNLDYLSNESSPLSYCSRLRRDGGFSPASPNSGLSDLTQKTKVDQTPPKTNFPASKKWDQEMFAEVLGVSRYLNKEDQSSNGVMGFQTVLSPGVWSMGPCNYDPNVLAPTGDFHIENHHHWIKDSGYSYWSKHCNNSATLSSSRLGTVSSKDNLPQGQIQTSLIRAPLELPVTTATRSSSIPELSMTSGPLETFCSGSMWFDWPQSPYSQPNWYQESALKEFTTNHLSQSTSTNVYEGAFV